MTNAGIRISNIDVTIQNIGGNIGLIQKHFYNNILKLPNAKYIDIGTRTGCSVCSGLFI